MKTTCLVCRDNPIPPATCRNYEVAAFTFLIQAPAAREALNRLGIVIPAEFQLVHNSKGDDPPDIEALGLRWEHTWYPPDQVPMNKVHIKVGAMEIPPLFRTGGNMKRIEEEALGLGKSPYRFDTEAEILGGLARFFDSHVLSGPRAKDIPSNDVLILDQRNDPSMDPERAARRILKKSPPKHLKLILLVRSKSNAPVPMPDVAVLYPHQE